MDIVLDKIIEAQLKLKRLTIAELSKRTQIPRTTLIDWKDGRKPSSKNLHHLLALSIYFEVTLTELLFGFNDDHGAEVLFTSTFKDGHTKYRLTIERISHLGGNND